MWRREHHSGATADVSEITKRHTYTLLSVWLSLLHIGYWGTQISVIIMTPLLSRGNNCTVLISIYPSQSVKEEEHPRYFLHLTEYEHFKSEDMFFFMRLNWKLEFNCKEKTKTKWETQRNTLSLQWKSWLLSPYFLEKNLLAKTNNNYS